MNLLHKNIRKILTFLLAVVFIVSACVVARKQLDYWNGAQEYTEAQQEAGLTLPAAPQTPQTSDAAVSASPTETDTVPEDDTTDPIVSALQALDFAALREKNADVLGWLLIPDTEINYPVLQSGDNEYYLTHTWNKEQNSVGSIFLDYRLPSDLSSFNTILYGHRMRNGSMFGSLKNYAQQEYWQQHPSIYIALPGGEVYRYDIFAAYEAAVDGAALQCEFATEDERTALISSALARSSISTGIEPSAADRVLTLSTCTGQGYSTRWVIHAVLREAG